jgi:hypothetical protein
MAYQLTIGRPRPNLVMFGLITPLAIALCRAPAVISTFASGNDASPASQREAVGGASTDRAPRSAPWLGIAALLLVTLDLLVVDVTLIEARPPESVFADGRAAAEWLADQPGRFRVYSPSYSIPQHVAERYTLELADGVDPLQLQPYADYLTRAAGLQSEQGYSVTLPPFPEGSDVQTALAGTIPNTEMLGQLGVRYVAAAFPIAHSRLDLMRRFGGVYLYQNQDARPPGGAASDPRIVLADGTELFRYRQRAVYVGWAISGLTLVGAVGFLWWVRQQAGNAAPLPTTRPPKG